MTTNHGHPSVSRASVLNSANDPWLIAIDLDSTTIDEAGGASDRVLCQLQRVAQLGHHLVVATGRSTATTLPVVARLGVWPEYVICSNGAVVHQRDPTTPDGYNRIHTVGFDAAIVLEVLRAHLPDAHFAVEDEGGVYRCTHPFPPTTIDDAGRQLLVPASALLDGNVVRVVAIEPGREVADFRAAVERMPLTGVTYSLGWTAWLDVAAEGITKAAAAEKIRAVLDTPRDRVMAVGDGYNDVDLLEWAGISGRGVAMGHAPDALLAVANEVTGTFADDGLAQVLATLDAQ